MSNIKLSVIIPAYNAEDIITSGVLEQVDEYLSKQKYSYEVIVVDDGSSDKTVEAAENHIKNKKNFTLLKNTHGGKAITVMTGLLASKGEISVFTDIDQATPLKEIEKFFPEFEQGYDIVIASRKERKGAPPVRKLAGWTFSLLRNIILGLPFRDTQCGFKAFNRRTIDEIFPKMLSRWKNMKVSGAAVNAGFDVEMLFIAKSKDLKIKEVDVNWQHGGDAKVRLVKDAIEAIKDLFRIRFSHMNGTYK